MSESSSGCAPQNGYFASSPIPEAEERRASERRDLLILLVTKGIFMEEEGRKVIGTKRK